MGIALTGVSIGGIVFPLMAQFVLDHFDWRTAMRLFALLLALVTFPIAMMVINRPADVGLHPDGDDKEPEHADADAYEATGLTSKAILADPTFWILALILSVFFSAMRGVITNIAPMAMNEGIDPTLIAWLVSSYAVAGLIAKLVYAWIADRASPKLLLAIVMVGGGAAHVCLIFAEQGLPAIAAGAVLIGLTGGSLLPMQGYLVPRIFGRAVVGKVSGLLGLALFVFNVFSPPLFGLIHDLFGNYDVVYLAYAVMTVAMVLLLPAMRIDPRPLTGPGDEVPIIIPD
jgi:sugar phosphate permease